MPNVLEGRFLMLIVLVSLIFLAAVVGYLAPSELLVGVGCGISWVSVGDRACFHSS